MKHKIDIIDKICFGCIIIVLVLIFCLAMWIDKHQNTKQYDKENMRFTEWISPDGVHYWIRHEGSSGFMAPRYDNEGNLIIDEIVEK